MTDRFERDLQRLLSTRAGQVSEATRAELARRRREVLDAAGPARPGWLAALTGKSSSLFGPGSRSWWLPAGAVAAALVAVVMMRPGTELMPAIAASDDGLDMEILLADENLDLYEDLEFFEWLAVVDDEPG